MDRPASHPECTARHKVVLIAVVASVALTVLGNEVNLSLTDVQKALTNTGDPGATSPYTCRNGTVAVLHGHKYHCQ